VIKNHLDIKINVEIFLLAADARAPQWQGLYPKNKAAFLQSVSPPRLYVAKRKLTVC
jgi:hypothetical protein